jgi:transglutaminase-like putative cysteine protease
MIYDVRQVTTYSYASKVAYAQHVLRLTPIDRAGQRVQASVLDVEPPPVGRREGHDFFGNRQTWIDLAQPHDRMVIKVAARIVVEHSQPPAPETTPAWDVVRDAVFASNDIGAGSPAHFVFPSRQVALDGDIRDYARASFPADRPILAGALDLMQRIHDDFTYEVGATTVSTAPATAFAQRRGVCQDFAHIMIAGLRGIGLPAAYVSGYLRTVPAPGAPTLQGADAMHAWVGVWCGEEAGWIGLDPTNALIAGDDHLVVAIGRDYADVAPIDGVVFASGGQRLAVAVTVTPVT